MPHIAGHLQQPPIGIGQQLQPQPVGQPLLLDQATQQMLINDPATAALAGNVNLNQTGNLAQRQAQFQQRVPQQTLQPQPVGQGQLLQQGFPPQQGFQQGLPPGVPPTGLIGSEQALRGGLTSSLGALSRGGESALNFLGGAADEAFGIQLVDDGDTTKFTSVDGARINLVLDDANVNAPDTTERELLSALTSGQTNGIYVEAQLKLIIDNDEGADDLDGNEIIDFEICGLVSDPANFTNDDVDIVVTAN